MKEETHSVCRSEIAAVIVWYTCMCSVLCLCVGFWDLCLLLYEIGSHLFTWESCCACVRHWSKCVYMWKAPHINHTRVCPFWVCACISCSDLSIPLLFLWQSAVRGLWAVGEEEFPYYSTIHWFTQPRVEYGTSRCAVDCWGERDPSQSKDGLSFQSPCSIIHHGLQHFWPCWPTQYSKSTHPHIG